VVHPQCIAAAFGGVNFMEFLSGDRVIVNPPRISPAYLCEFEASLLVCFTGQARASAIIQDQVKSVATSDAGTLAAMHQLKSDAIDMKQALSRGNIQEVAEVLNRSWQAKRRTSDLISNTAVEEVFDLGLKNGAVAGKVSGAGGGFLMFMTDPGATLSPGGRLERGRRDRFAGPVHHRRGRGVGDQPLTARFGRRHPPGIGISSRR
jgi:D-glycero-alpha-D-manno-heptose-7-phosphate kinase